jgi:hypothetical protein
MRHSNFMSNEVNQVNMSAFYKKGKVWLNTLLDRVVDLANMVLMDVYPAPRLVSRTMAYRLARVAGDVSLFLRDFPRLSAYKLAGKNWTLIFAGSMEGVREIQRLFFPEEEITPQEIGRVALWRLQAQTEKWLGEVDLVICELSRLHPWRPKAANTFIVPVWVQQVVELVEPVTSIIVGDKRAHLRHQINRLQRAGFTYCFSQSLKEFDHFYYHMYLPFVKGRHEDLALVAPYEDQKQRWFNKGGLVLITQNDKAVAGNLCYLANGTCFAIESGVLEADPHLFQQGINTFLLWSVALWGHSQGAQVFDMGGSHGWHSHGSFSFKRRWGARVTRRRRIYATWTFLAQNLSPALQAHINKLGFISEIDDKFYMICIEDTSASLDSLETQPSRADTAQDLGLAGWALVTPNAETIVYNKEANVTFNWSESYPSKQSQNV